MPEEEKFEKLARPEIEGSSEQAFTPEKVEDKSPFVIERSDNRNVNQVTGKIAIKPVVATATSTRKFLKIHPDFLVSGVLEADATITTTAAATETTLNSYTVPLNSISRNDSNTEKAGNVFRIWAAGTYGTNNGVDTCSIRLKVGSTTYHTITTTAGIVTDVPWYINWTIIISATGASGTAESFAESRFNNLNKDSGSTATRTIDTTADQTISITEQWADAGNTISIRQFMVELLN